MEKSEERTAAGGPDSPGSAVGLYGRCPHHYLPLCKVWIYHRWIALLWGAFFYTEEGTALGNVRVITSMRATRKE